MGQAVSRIRVPSKATLEREIDVVKKNYIPLLVVTGGWNPAFEINSDHIASRGNGRRLVIRSSHHFPHLISDEFNLALAKFMETVTLANGAATLPKH